MRVNKTKIQHNIDNLDKVKIFSFFRVLFFSFCLVATLVSITQSFNKVSAVEGSSSATASVTVSSACSFSRVNEGDGNYTGTLANNSSTEVTGSTFTTFCNDPGGYDIYAVGYSNNTFGNTDLIFDDTPNSINNIKTDGNGSHWGMSLSASESGKPSIESGFGDSNNPHTIPSTYTKIASYNTTTAGLNTDTNQQELLGQSVTVTYSATVSSTQPAGTYTGAVKYTMVHPNNADAPTPTIDDIQYLQDFANLNSSDKTALINSMAEGQIYTKKDKRDEQEYTIAKLKDGKVWMTKNLNLAGGTALSADDTDVDNSYIESFTTSNNLTKTGSAIVLPESSTSGFKTNNYSYVYNSGNITVSQSDCTSTQPCNSYYSWDAATLGSGRNINTENTDAPYSICSKGWKLPTSRSTNAPNWQIESDFYILAHQYGLDSVTSTSEWNNGFYKQAGPSTTPNFLLAGNYYDASFFSGNSRGFYWSSTSHSSNRTKDLGFYSSLVKSADDSYRMDGYAVRCLVK